MKAMPATGCSSCGPRFVGSAHLWLRRNVQRLRTRQRCQWHLHDAQCHPVAFGNLHQWLLGAPDKMVRTSSA